MSVPARCLPFCLTTLLGCSALTTLDFAPPPAGAGDSFLSDSVVTDSIEDSIVEDDSIAESGATVDADEVASDGKGDAESGPPPDAGCTAGSCGGLTCCASDCTDTATDSWNCGSCGKKCTTHQNCSGGACCTKKTYPCGAVSCCGSCVSGYCT